MLHAMNKLKLEEYNAKKSGLKIESREPGPFNIFASKCKVVFNHLN